MCVLNPEIEEGNVEYKRYLLNLDDIRLEQLSSQMKWRLAEGDNEAIYYLGVNDNGSLYHMNEQEKKETFVNFNLLVKKNKAEIISSYAIKSENSTGNNITYFKVKIRQKKKIYPEIRVLLLGDSETGKTTFLANLLLDKPFTDKLDPRIYLMNHKHELESKKTSSINCNYIIYNNIKYAFIEAPGSHEYLRTKYKLLLGTNPNVILLFEDPNGKSNQFDKLICESLMIPIIQTNIFNSESDFYCKNPIDKAKLFDKINGLYKQNPNPNPYDKSKTKFNILNMYPHNDLGSVVSGFLAYGNLKVGQYINWNYRDDTVKCKIQSIHINSEPVNEIYSNQMLTLCLKTPGAIKKQWKQGFLSNDIIPDIKTQVEFIFEKKSGELLGSVYGFYSNRVVHVSNIIKSGDKYTGIIENDIPTNSLVIIDYCNVQGIIRII